VVIVAARTLELIPEDIPEPIEKGNSSGASPRGGRIVSDRAKFISNPEMAREILRTIGGILPR
jgi:hypothetical protein